MVVNTHYKENLKAVMQVAKKYTDDKIEQALELLEDYELSSETISQTSQTATAPSDVRTSSLIEVGGNCVKYAPSEASNKNVAYKKSIPNNTYKLFADKIGGMSYKSENLLVLTDETKTVSSVTFTIQNGKISSSGTPTNTGWIKIKEFTLNAGTYSYADLTTNTSKVYLVTSNYVQLSTTFTLSETTTVFIGKTGNDIINNGNVSNSMPMLVKGSTAPTEFKQGFSGIRNTAVSQLIVSGNLLDKINYQLEIGAISGAGADSSSTTRIRFDNNSRFYLTAGTYTLSFKNLTNYIWYGYTNTTNTNATYNVNGNWQNNKTSFTLTNDCYVRFAFKYSDDRTITSISEITEIMLNSGDIAKPYVTPIIKPIPSEIQALDGYGWGISESVCNYIDFDRKVFVQNVGRVDLGTLNWIYASNNRFYSSDLTTKVCLDTSVYNAISDKYNVVSRTNVTNADKSLSISKVSESSSSFVNVYDTAYTDTTAFKNAMNGVYLYYELATPIETDVSQYLTDFNPIETNDLYGEIEFVNTYNQDMPNEISFVGTIKETLVTSFTIGSETTNITDSIESDGWSASSTVFNTRKTRDKERHKVVGRIDLGSLTYFYDSANNRFTVTIDNIKNVLQTEVPNAMCCCYDILAFNTIIANPTRDLVIGFNTSGVMTIKNFAYTDETNFKNAMSGIYLYYELATPVVTPLDVDTDFHYIYLESGETITFNNANNQVCHNTIRYSIMEEKV